MVWLALEGALVLAICKQMWFFYVSSCELVSALIIQRALHHYPKTEESSLVNQVETWISSLKFYPFHSFLNSWAIKTLSRCFRLFVCNGHARTPFYLSEYNRDFVERQSSIVRYLLWCAPIAPHFLDGWLSDSAHQSHRRACWYPGFAIRVSVKWLWSGPRNL